MFAELLLGPHCPLCNCRVWPRFHRCPVVKGMATGDAVRMITGKVREILQDEPADRLVHDACAAMDELDGKFREQIAEQENAK